MVWALNLGLFISIAMLFYFSSPISIFNLFWSGLASGFPNSKLWMLSRVLANAAPTICLVLALVLNFQRYKSHGRGVSNLIWLFVACVSLLAINLLAVAKFMGGL